jgi:hypothetical protein
MSKTEAGRIAGTEPIRMLLRHEVSPAARKFAEYIARRLAPKLERAAQQHHATPTAPQHNNER